ncbi:MAG: UvrD-helicase domain-containing protein [Candidatus Thermoplasmatota archaeon]|nr:UvrD-helicase domain-containing protein [Candidatus Thermoplasmatota archaeon]
MNGPTPRQRDALVLERDRVVTAGAGSGKTWVLVQRYISILRDDPKLRPGNILALTFTDKAAAEMRAKVGKALRDMSAADPARYEPMLDDLLSADISTIHSFCSRIVRSEPLSLGLDPDPEVLSEAGARKLFDEAFNELLRKSGDHSASIRRLIVDHGVLMLREAMHGMIACRGSSRIDLSSEEAIHRSLSFLDASLRLMMGTAEDGLPTLSRAIRELGSLPRPAGEDNATRLVEVLSGVIDMVSQEEDPGSIVRAFSRVHRLFLTGKGQKRSPRVLGKKEVWKGSIDVMRTHLGTVVDFAFDNKDLLSYMKDGLDRRTRRTISDLAAVYASLENEYARAKRAKRALDFDDMVSLALRLLKGPGIKALEALRSKYSHIMVDEFQDTDPRQWELVRLIRGEGGTARLFLVGDPKQSIYGFRSSDVRIFSEAREMLEGDSVVLDRNFRSRREIMEFANSLFPSVMGEGGSRWGVPFEPLDAVKSDGARLNIIGVAGREEEEFREGVAVARLLKRALREGWPVLDGNEGDERPIEIEDIAILVRGRTRLEHYERGFRSEGLPYVVYKGKGFFERQEISDVIQLLEFLCCPVNDVALASVLKGPLFSLDDEELFRMSSFPGLTLLQKLRSSPDHSPHGDRLLEYIKLARTYPAHVAVGKIISDGAMYAMMDGRRGCRNLDRLIEIVTQTRGTLFDLRDELREMAEGQSGEGEPPLSSKNAVSLMTIHAAKGLEWPMVVLMGMHHLPKGSDRSFVRVDPDRGLTVKVFDPDTGETVRTPSHVEAALSREELEGEEAKRLLYVACTRAKDHLVLSGRIPAPGDNDMNPKGLMALLTGSVPIDWNAMKEGKLEWSGLELELIAHDRIVEDDSTETVRTTRTGTVNEKLVLPIKTSGDEVIIRPSETDPSTVDGTHLDAGGICSPDQFGTMVHEVLSGKDPHRAALEMGYPEEEIRIGPTAQSMESLVPEGALRSFDEISLLSSVEGERMRGRIDRLLKMRDGSWVVIDFKTGSRQPHHEEQVQRYVRAVSRITGDNAKGMVIYQDGAIEVGEGNEG